MPHPLYFRHGEPNAAQQSRANKAPGLPHDLRSAAMTKKGYEMRSMQLATGVINLKDRE